MLITNDDRLQSATLVSYLDNRPAEKVRRLAAVYPEQPVYDLDVAYNVLEDSGIKAASIIGLDAGAPIRNKGEMKHKMATLTKVAHSYTYTETEMFKYRKARDEAEQNQIVLNAVQEVGKLHEGVEDIKEYMRAQMTYNGRFHYEDSKSETKLEFALDLPEEAEVEVDIYSNPLELLQEQVAAYKERNNQLAPAYMVMNSSTLAKLKRNPIIRKELYGENDRLVRNSDLTELLVELELPELVVDDNQTVIEGVKEDTVHKHMADDKIVMHGAELGNTFIGPSIENDDQIGVYVVNIVSQDPWGEKTIVGQVTFPVLKNINQVQIINITAEDTP